MTTGKQVLVERQFDVVVGAPADFTQAERDTFIQLVRAGGEVGGTVLEQRVSDAKALIVLRLDGQISGIAALKTPAESYRKRISKSARAELPAAAYPYELGYVFIVESARGQKLSGKLVTNALAGVVDTGVFATARTDNDAMNAALCKAGFVKAGEPYLGRNKRHLHIFVRPA